MEAGADGLVMINTLLGLHIDLDTMRPTLGGVTGGLSGPGDPPGRRARGVAGRRSALPGVPIIGVGGIRTGADALEFLAAGATRRPGRHGDLQRPVARRCGSSRELRAELAARGFAKVSDAIGLRPPHRPDRATEQRGGDHDGTVRHPPPRTRWTTRGPLCVGIDPHASLLRDWGLDDDPAGLERFAMTVRRGARRPRSPCSSRSRRSSSGTARRGIAVLETAVAAARDAGALVLLDAKRGDIGSTMQGYADAYLDQSLADGGRRDDGQPVPRLRVAAPGARHGGRRTVPASSCWPDLQPRRPAGAARAHGVRHGGRRDAGGHRRRERRRRAAGLGRRGRRGQPGRAATRTSRSTARCWRPASAPREAAADDVRRIFAAALPNVLPTTSREVLSAGPDASALREAAQRARDVVSAAVSAGS